MTYPFEVSSGIAHARPTKAASRRMGGVRPAVRATVPSGPPGPVIRSPERRTHSSAPICGDVAGCGVPGVSADISDLGEHGRAADPGRPEKHEDDEDREDD